MFFFKLPGIGIIYIFLQSSREHSPVVTLDIDPVRFTFLVILHWRKMTPKDK